MALPRDLVSQFEKLVDERVRRALMGSAFTNSGMTVTGPGQFEIDGSVTVTGDFTAEGKISNAALVSPLVPATAHADATNFSVPTDWNYIMSVTVPVPPGFTKALILSLTTAVSAYNSTAATDWLYCSASIAAYGSALPGWVISSPNVDSNEYGSAIDYRSVLLTGLSGSFVIEGAVMSDSGTWAADSTNYANMDVSILFLR